MEDANTLTAEREKRRDKIEEDEDLEEEWRTEKIAGKMVGTE